MDGLQLSRARRMRKAMSPAELNLWLPLRALRSEGWHFRRQSPEGPYILDFVCRRAMLVVEVDGVHHSDSAQSKHDETRDAFILGRGFQVLRFWAADVHNELEGVVQTVRAVLGPADPTRRAARDTLPVPGREGGVRHRFLTRLGLRPRPPQAQ